MTPPAPPVAKTVKVRRFQAEATPEQKKEFATALVAAMDELQILPGEEFVLTTNRWVDKMEEDLDEAQASVHEAKGEAESAVADREELIEKARDVERGIRDMPELIEAVEEFARYV